MAQNQGEVEHLNKQVRTGKENMWNSTQQTVKPKKMVKIKFYVRLERNSIYFPACMACCRSRKEITIDRFI